MVFKKTIRTNKRTSYTSISKHYGQRNNILNQNTRLYYSVLQVTVGTSSPFEENFRKTKD